MAAMPTLTHSVGLLVSRLKITGSPFYVLVQVVSPDQDDLDQLENHLMDKSGSPFVEVDKNDRQKLPHLKKQTSVDCDITHFTHKQHAVIRRLNSCDQSNKSETTNRLELSADNYSAPPTIESDAKKIPFPNLPSDINLPESPGLIRRSKYPSFPISEFRPLHASKLSHQSKNISTEIFGAFCAHSLPHGLAN
jgi:hypothetical protein